ncbi:hypothetical protein [Aquirufa salirivi]|uniref:Heparinase II/III-like protein n=1 Tax=Aquirufa salirivi TaxID=3104729 RepID=A0ABW8RTK6_9BACT
MSAVAQIKNVIKRALPKQLVQAIRNEINLAHIPNHPQSVISDLFSFKISNGWETHFELLNVSALIDPLHQINSSYTAKFLFFDELGNQIHACEKEVKGCSRQSINLNEVLEGKSVSGYGTFACFHLNFLPHLMDQGAFLAERGYTGYRNKAISNMKGYVHGNLDALAMNDRGEVICLGKSFRLQKNEYRLQYQLEGPATYDLGVVNTTRASEDIRFELISNKRTFNKEYKKVPSKGVVWFSVELEKGELARVVVHSKINLPRPVVFRSGQNSFDVFHG